MKNKKICEIANLIFESLGISGRMVLSDDQTIEIIEKKESESERINRILGRLIEIFET